MPPRLAPDDGAATSLFGSLVVRVSGKLLIVTIPRQSRGLSFMSRSKRLIGVANAAPLWEPPKGGVSVTKSDLAVENVISGHCFTQPVFLVFPMVVL